MKPVKRSVAVVVRREPGEARGPLLAIRRPADDEDLPNIWGLAAATLRRDEGWEDGVRRAGREKLGVVLAPVRELNEGTQERVEYTLQMKLFEARIVEGEPAVPQPVEGVTRYVDWKWATAADLVEGAERGSLCCQLFLEQAEWKGARG